MTKESTPKKQQPEHTIAGFLQHRPFRPSKLNNVICLMPESKQPVALLYKMRYSHGEIHLPKPPSTVSHESF